MRFRKYEQFDPFEAAKRNINSQLYSIEERILSKYEQGGQREMMRRTIRKLLQNESSIEKKIKVLLSIVDSHSLHQLPQEIQEDKQINYSTIDVQRQRQRQWMYKSRKGRYSPLGSNKRPTQQFQTKRFSTDYSGEQLNRYINYGDSSFTTPYSTLSNTKEENPLRIQYTQQYSVQNKEADNDIFSFRTQNHQYPSKRKNYSKEHQETNSFQKIDKKPVYDGYSQYKSSSKNNFPLQTSHLYQKISKRLKYSPCVMDKVLHSTSNASSQGFESRFKLEQEGRRSLIRLIQRPLPK